MLAFSLLAWPSLWALPSRSLVLFLFHLLFWLANEWFIIVLNDHFNELLTQSVHALIPLLILNFLFLLCLLLHLKLFFSLLLLWHAVVISDLQVRSQMSPKVSAENWEIIICHVGVCIIGMFPTFLLVDPSSQVNIVSLLIAGMIYFVQKLKSTISRWPRTFAFWGSLEGHKTFSVKNWVWVIVELGSQSLVLRSPCLVIVSERNIIVQAWKRFDQIQYVLSYFVNHTKFS